jgi:hypothetical protein
VAEAVMTLMCVRVEVLTVVLLKMQISWDVMVCSVCSQSCPRVLHPEGGGIMILKMS